jgi:hypothetical protein
VTGGTLRVHSLVFCARRRRSYRTGSVDQEPIQTYFFCAPRPEGSQSVISRNATDRSGWNDRQSWEQVVMVASRQDIEWDVLAAWFIKKSAGEGEFRRFRHAAGV